MRLVLDTNVVVAAFRSDRGASRQLLLHALDRTIEMAAWVPLMIGYQAVLTRREQLEATGLTIDETNAVLDTLAAAVNPVSISFLWRPKLRDPADEMVLETAVNGQADALVTFNVRHFDAAKEFGLPVLTPRDAWNEVRERNAKK